MTPNKEQIEIYLKRRLADWQNGQDALKKSDFFVLEKIGHQMKGNGVSFGFPELSDLGEKIEMMAQEKKSKELEKLWTEFAAWIKSKMSDQ